uniref:Uncharacterized protein n=1 Tax=Oryza meridionalis TaxID=40149 RepID=A0A0E0D265_9ORYZ
MVELSGLTSMVAEETMVDWPGVARKMVMRIESIESRLGAATRYAEATRDTLDYAAGLLQEDTDAADTLAADFFAVLDLDAPAAADHEDEGESEALIRRLPDQASVDAAAARLAAVVFSGAPVLPDNILISRDLIAGVCVFRHDVAGLLQNARLHLGVAIDRSNTLNHMIRSSSSLADRPVGTGSPGASQDWMDYQERVIEQGSDAELRLFAAVKAAMDAQGAHPLCVVRSPQHEEHMEEAKQHLRTATGELDEALAALLEMRRDVESQEILVRRWGAAEAEASAREAALRRRAAAPTATDGGGDGPEGGSRSRWRTTLRGHAIEHPCRKCDARGAKAATLLREDIHASKILVEDAFAVVPARDDLDPDRVLRGARCSQGRSPQPWTSSPACAPSRRRRSSGHSDPERNAQRLPGVVGNDHDKARHRFVDCAPELGIQERGETWLKWSIHRHRAFVAEVTAETCLSSAISEAQIAVRQHRLYKELPSLSPGERARETWKVEEIVSTTINEVDAVLVAVRRMRVAVVREAIDDAAP